MDWTLIDMECRNNLYLMLDFCGSGSGIVAFTSSVEVSGIEHNAVTCLSVLSALIKVMKHCRNPLTPTKKALKKSPARVLRFFS